VRRGGGLKQQAAAQQAAANALARVSEWPTTPLNVSRFAFHVALHLQHPLSLTALVFPPLQACQHLPKLVRLLD